MPKLLRLQTPFDGPVYINPEHVTAVCKPKDESAFPRTKVFLSGGIEFDVRGDIREIAQQVEDALSEEAEGK
jgi:hypothetical protein